MPLISQPLRLNSISQRLLVAAAVLCMVTAPGVAGTVAPRIAGPESPLEAEEEFQERLEEGVINGRRRVSGQRRTAATSDSRKSLMNAAQAGRLQRRNRAVAPYCGGGHRLANGVLAPMIC